MKLYVVDIRGDYEGGEVDSVHSSLEKAEARCTALGYVRRTSTNDYEFIRPDWPSYGAQIIELTLDEVPQ